MGKLRAFMSDAVCFCNWEVVGNEYQVMVRYAKRFFEFRANYGIWW